MDNNLEDSNKNNKFKIDESNDWALKAFSDMFKGMADDEETKKHNQEQLKIFRKNKNVKKKIINKNK